MITLAGAIIGLLGSFLPDLLSFFKAKQEHLFEMEMMRLQIEGQERLHTLKLEEINVQADIAEAGALYKHASRPTGIAWIEGLIGSVRPVITYCFFVLYASVKASQMTLALSALGGDWARALPAIWHEQDQVIFATIICFWFGGRAMQKLRQGK